MHEARLAAGSGARMGHGAVFSCDNENCTAFGTPVRLVRETGESELPSNLACYCGGTLRPAA